MNTFLRLAMICSLAVGTLGLGTPTKFSAGQCDRGESGGKLTSCAPDGQGETILSSNKSYVIYNRISDKSNQVVAVVFDCGHDSNCLIDKKLRVCDKGQGGQGKGICEGTITEKITGHLCMRTGVGKGDDERGYKFGQPACFPPASSGGA